MEKLTTYDSSELLLRPYINKELIPFNSVTSTALVYQSLNGSSEDLNEEEAPPSNVFTTVLIVFILTVIILVTIIGNILVCVAVCLVRKLRRPYNYLLVSLAVSDLCVAILVMPMALLHELLGEWQFGRTVCDIWVSFDVLSCTASILNLCMISVDRYLAITRPLEYGVKRTPKRMVAYIAIVWIGAAFVSVPPVLILGNEHGDGSICQVCQNFWYQIYATFGSFYFPLAVMVTVYFKIFKAAKRIVDEERKAQAHLKLVEEQDKNYHQRISNNITHADNNQQSSPNIISRYSVVQINNGEVETRLAPTSHLQKSSSLTDWNPNLPEKLNLRNNVQLVSSASTEASNMQSNKHYRKFSGTQLLEVPIHDAKALEDTSSPVSTSTTYEIWSLYPSKEDDMSTSTMTKESFVPSISAESKTLEEKNSNNIKSSLISPSSKEGIQQEVKETLIENEEEMENYDPIEDQISQRLWTPPISGHNQMADTKPPQQNSQVYTNSAVSEASSLLHKKHGDETDTRRKSSSGSSSKKRLMHPNKSKLRITLAKERKASTTLGIIMSAFIVCWLPFFVLALVRPFLKSPNDIPASVSSLFLWLGYANSLLNPIIYATLNKDFRKPFQEILCLRCSNLNLLMREEFYYSQYGPDTPTHSHNRGGILPHRDSADINTETKAYSWQQAVVVESRF